jgi:hypothetical protein
MSLQQLIFRAQFGPGFEPPVPNNVYTDKANESPLANLEIMISNTLGLLTVGAGIFFIFYFLLAAIGMIAAGGDSGKLNKAKDQMLHGALGLIIVVAAYAIIGLLGSVIGLDILNPKGQLCKLVPGGSPSGDCP